MMLKRKRNSLLLFAWMAFACHGQTTLDYNSFLSVVKQNNPLARKANNNKEYAKVQYRASQGGFDPQISSSVENKFFNGTDYFTVGRAELKQALYTSQYLKVGYQYGQGQFLNPENSTSLAGVPYVGLQASLLQGLLFDKNRADVIKGRYYVDYFNAEEKIQLNDLLFVSSNTYLDYLYSKKVNDLYAYFTNLAHQRLKGITELSDSGERPQVDTIEASIFLQGRILDKKAGELELNKKHNELMVLSSNQQIGLDQFQVLDSMDNVFMLAQKTILQSILDQAPNNPIISQYIAKQKILETEARLKREMIKPVLDVNYNFLNNSYNTALPVFNTGNYKWGASFSLPLFLRKPRNDYKMAKLISENNALELRNKKTQIDYKRHYIISAVHIVTDQISNAEKAASYSKMLVEAERLRFNHGESSLFLLNARENKWLESELKLAEYKLKYLKTCLELIYVEGSLKYEFNF